MQRSTYSPTLPAEARSEYPRLKATGRMQEIAAISSKMVPDPYATRFGQTYIHNSGRSNRQLQAPDFGLLQRISDLTANDVSDAQSIFQLLPETELAMQILVSSILAPKDLVTTGVNFTLESNRFNSELAGSMLNVVTEHFEKIYKIRDILKPSLENALFLTGSYPLLILPESSIDQAINNPGRISMESLNEDIDTEGKVRNLGFLGNPSSEKEHQTLKINFGLESFGFSGEAYQGMVTSSVQLPGLEAFTPLLEVVDNPNVLKMSALQERIRHDRTLNLLGRRNLTALRSATHSVSQEAYREAVALKNRVVSENKVRPTMESYTTGQRLGVGAPYGTQYQHNPVEMIRPARDLHRKTYGHPLVMKLPSESIIPIHQPSNPEKHLGYFVILDAMGNPINSVSQRDFYADMANSLNPVSSMGSQLIQQAKRGMQGQATDRQSEIDEMTRIYGQFLEKELTERLRAGIHGDTVEITGTTEVYRVMLSRAMARKQTRLLYIPAEMMVYIAFDYNKYGIGQSLLQASKVLGGIRVLSLFAETMASIKNAINRTKVGIQLDPEDPNPGQTVEFLMGEYAKTRQGSFPLGATNPTDVISYLQNASVDVEVTGNTRWPEVKFEVSERASMRVKPDEQMTESLRDRHLMAMGLTPDMVDAGEGAEFATSVVANNLLLAKRVLNYQSVLEEFLRDFVKKYILADGHLMSELEQLIEENRNKLTSEQQKSHLLSEKAEEQRNTLRKADGEKVSNENINEHLEKLEEMGRDAIIMEFLQAILVSLPKPDMATVKSQMDAFADQDEAYNKALDMYLGEEIMEAKGLGGLKDVMSAAKIAAKADLMRRWMRDNNVLPEVHEMFAGEDEDRPDIFKNITDHVESMGDSLLRVMYEFAKQRGQRDDAVKKLAKLLNEEADYDSYSSGMDSTFGAPEAGGDMGGDVDGGDVLDDMPAMPGEGEGEEGGGEVTVDDIPATPGDEEEPQPDA